MPLVRAQHAAGTSTFADSALAAELRDLIGTVRPKRILESGAFHATGTTRVIGEALKAHHIGADFRTIEVRAENCDAALANIARHGLPVTLCYGLSIPAAMLPTRDEIAEELKALDARPDAVWADFDPTDRAEWYYAETHHPGVADDLIGHVLREWEGRCDLLMLDSAGHLGWREFRHALHWLRSPCWWILDDAAHLKHVRSVEYMRMDPRFRIVAEGSDKFGWTVAQFVP